METLKLAAISDLHIGAENNDRYYSKREWLETLDNMSNINGLIMAGDLTHRGTTEQAYDLSSILNTIGIGERTYAVLGNHDEDAGKESEICRILEGESGVTMLNGKEYKITNDSVEVGIVGLSGSIGRIAYKSLKDLQGEQKQKNYVDMCMRNVFPIYEEALSGVKSNNRIMVQHYPLKPVRGVPLNDSVAYDALPSKFEEEIDKYKWKAIIDGHEHGPHTRANPKDVFWMDFTRGGNPIYHMAAPLHKQLNKSPILYLSID